MREKIKAWLKVLNSKIKTTDENRIFAIIFLTVITGFFSLSVLVPDKSFSENENRMLQNFPEFNVASYMDGKFERKLEDYSNDQFILRPFFIKMKTAIDVSSGSLYSNNVWRSKDGYLIEDTTVPTDERIDGTIEALKGFKKKNSSIKMNFMLAPNAVSVLKDKLPLGAVPEDQNVYMDKMFEGVSSAGIGVVDVRPAFEKAKKDTQLYYYTDHHWTTDGALIAFNEFRSKVGLDKSIEFENYAVTNNFIGTLASKSGFIGGKADIIKLGIPKDTKSHKDSIIFYEDSKEKTTKFYVMKNLKKKDAYTVFGGSNHPVYTIKTPTKENKRLLLIKDSYANSLIPYLSQFYREIVVVDPRYYFESIQDLIAVEQINEVLFVYNANTFFGDDSLKLMLSE